MEKRFCLAIVIGVLILVNFVFLVSASYECSEGFSSDNREIDLYSARTVNGLKMGLYWSADNAVNSKYYADFFVDSEDFILTSVEDLEVELKKGIYNFSLINSTGETVRVYVDGGELSIVVGETESFKGIEIYLVSLEGDNPNEEAKFLIGEEKLRLDSDNDEILYTYDSKEYLIKLFSASDDNAILDVGTCEGDFSLIVDVVEEELNESVDDVNGSVVDVNVSLDGINESINDLESLNISENKSDAVVGEGFEEDSENGVIRLIFFWIIFVAFILVLVWYLKIKFLEG